MITAAVRVAGGLLFAAILHQVFAATGWLSAPLEPAWMPMSQSAGWLDFAVGLVNSLIAMLVVLLALSWTMEILRISGVMDWLNKGIAPLFLLAGIRSRTEPFAAVGLFLGISYGGGLLIREARSTAVEPRRFSLPASSWVLPIRYRGYIARRCAWRRFYQRLCRPTCLRRAGDRADCPDDRLHLGACVFKAFFRGRRSRGAGAGTDAAELDGRQTDRAGSGRRMVQTPLSRNEGLTTPSTPYPIRREELGHKNRNCSTAAGRPTRAGCAFSSPKRASRCRWCRRHGRDGAQGGDGHRAQSAAAPAGARTRRRHDH